MDEHIKNLTATASQYALNGKRNQFFNEDLMLTGGRTENGEESF